MSENKEIDIKPRSREVTDGASRAPARAMLRAVGMGEEDFSKAQIGVASSWNEVTPVSYTHLTLVDFLWNLQLLQ